VAVSRKREESITEERNDRVVWANIFQALGWEYVDFASRLTTEEVQGYVRRVTSGRSAIMDIVAEIENRAKL
jgi:hypothetical protein